MPSGSYARDVAHDTSIERYRAHEVIRVLIVQLRGAAIYDPPQVWWRWADAFLKEEATLELAVDAHYALAEQIRWMPNGLTPGYPRAEAARLLARAALALPANPGFAKRVAEAAA